MKYNEFEVELVQDELGYNVMTESLMNKLSAFLISVVHDGASVGFLSPLREEVAIQYWSDVVQPGIILWIVKCEQEVVGTVQLHLAKKSNGLHRAEVCKLMVSSNYRRMGIAKQLMDAVETKAKDIGRSLLVLDTREGDPSNFLYKQLGYVEVGKIPKYAKSSDGKLDGTVLYYKEI